MFYGYSVTSSHICVSSSDPSAKWKRADYDLQYTGTALRHIHRFPGQRWINLSAGHLRSQGAVGRFIDCCRVMMTGSCAQAAQQIGVAQYADHSPSLPDPLCTTDTRAGRWLLGDRGLDAARGKPAESRSVRGNGFDSAKVPIRICALNCMSIYAL